LVCGFINPTNVTDNWTFNDDENRLAQHDPPLALKNTGVLNRQSLAGALATGTHGTGVKFPIMSEQVRLLVFG
jgi:hypothetical protein